MYLQSSIGFCVLCQVLPSLSAVLKYCTLLGYLNPSLFTSTCSNLPYTSLSVCSFLTPLLYAVPFVICGKYGGFLFANTSISSCATSGRILAFKKPVAFDFSHTQEY